MCVKNPFGQCTITASVPVVYDARETAAVPLASSVSRIKFSVLNFGHPDLPTMSRQKYVRAEIEEMQHSRLNTGDSFALRNLRYMPSDRCGALK